ncbi:carbohydrate ABC transporter permease [Micromonospora tulbaghiae]|uniref:carbohydrate ABC transporter permease n=1 Tax=Micromonospora tulbaghiae TaxID=479978 RepID=UPI0029C2FA60|nr:carbohydrate ABC transporter permease [Micromonospora tulbaghiae]MDX5458752.1 carbohydrate ABC transporter permease [Micromonospora tulbaghiae]
MLFVLALVAAAVVFLLPFVWLVGASLRPREYVFAPGLLPTPFAPDNYARAWDAMPLFTWLFNSVVVGVAAAAAATLSSAWVAFGFAYFRFPGRNLLFGLVLATMMLPFAVTMIPTYLIWNRLGLVDTQVPLWAGNLFGSAFYIFLLRQFFLSLPREYFEAARVDGAGYPQLFWRMAFPLVRPALLVAFVFEFKASWTDLVKPLIYLRNEQLYTLPRGLKVILDRFGYGGEQQWEVVLAASVIATVPMIILFFLAQRHFVEGIATGGRKG